MGALHPRFILPKTIIIVLAYLVLLSVVLDDESPVLVKHTTKSSNEPDLSPGLNGFTKPINSFPQMIAKALALSPDYRATAHSICDRIANMQPFYKYHNGNWKKSVNSSLTRNKNIFACSRTNENGEYIWSFNPNFKKFVLNKWLPNYLQKKGKLVNVTDSIVQSKILKSSPTVASNIKMSSVNSLDPDIIVESEMLTSSSTVAENSTVSSVNSLDPDIIVESDIFTSSPTVNSSNTTNSSFGSLGTLRTLCEQSSINISSKFPIGDNTYQFVTEGFQPPNTLTSSEKNVTYHHANLNQTISKPRAETQYGNRISSKQSFPEFALADPVQLEDHQPDEINPWEPEATVSGRPTLFISQTLRINILIFYV